MSWTSFKYKKLELTQRREQDARTVCLTVWKENKKPFFRVYPKLVECLINTSLDIPMSYIKQALSKFVEDTGIQSLCLCFRNPIELNDLFVSSVVLYLDEVSILAIFQDQKGETICNIPLGVTGSVYEATKDYCADQRLISLLCGVMLLASQGEYMERLVLKKFLHKFKDTQDIDLVIRSKNRGFVGWSVGEELETKISTHFRRPHFAVRWTGKGGTVPKLVLVKGSIVNKNKIPTGFLDKPEQPTILD